MCAQDLITFTELPAAEREILWEKRHYLNPVPIVEIERRWTEKFTRGKAAALLDLKDRLESEEAT